MIPYTDVTYWGVLLYPTLPTFLIAWGRRLRQAWIVLATAGMLFVQYSAERLIGGSGPVREVTLVLGFALVQYCLATGLLLLRRRTNVRWTIWPAVVLTVIPLVASRLGTGLTGLGFLGISYLTFRALDVLLGIHDGLIRELSPGGYAAYMLFFPTVSAGPIDRYRRFVDDWLHARSRSELLRDLDGAVHRIFTGFLYKFILAELIRRYWMDPATTVPGVLATVSYMYAYSLYLFFDFAGYTAFAVGVSYLFGVHPPENFRRPFLARDIRDFWNRWHISLSWWLRDHVYMRFAMTATRRHWFRDRYLASYSGFFLSMGLMGLWHGLEVHYLVYGLYHAALLTAHDLFSRWNKRYGLWGDGFVWHVAGVVVTVQFVCFGFLIFSGRFPLPS